MQENEPEAEEQAAPSSPYLNADRAAWLQDRLRAFVLIVEFLTITRTGAVTADNEMHELALEGAIRGQAREITRIMGFEPGENLERPPKKKVWRV